MRHAMVLSAGLAAGALALAWGVPALAKPEVAWRTGGAGTAESEFLAAAEQARTDGKPLVLFAWDDDDAPFKDTGAAFEDPAVGALAGKFVFVKIDCEAGFWKSNLKEAYDAAPWVFVLDPRLEKPCAAPLAKIAGEHKPGGGIPAAKIQEALKAGLVKYGDAKVEGALPKLALETPPAPAAKEPAKDSPAKDTPAKDVGDRAMLGVQTLAGVPVLAVPEGTAAAKAGIKPGDVILAVGETRVSTQAELLAALAKRKPGDTLTIVVARDSKMKQIAVTLGSAVEYAKAHPQVEEEGEEGEEGEEAEGGEGAEGK